MIKYPLVFEVNAESTSGIETKIEGKAENFPPIDCAIPKEFNGPGSGYSPEDLYALAVVSCLIATFKVFAEKTQFVYSDIKGSAKLTIDRGAGGIPELKKLDITLTLTGVQDEEKAKTLFAEAEKYCLVSNAIKSEKTFTHQILP